MATYSNLLLSSGGGIISAKQQADQVKNVATILIGLGGTGVHCIRTIKTQVYERLKQDNPDSVFPTYEHIRFIGVDTDIKSFGTQENTGNEKNKNNVTKDRLISLRDEETFQISIKDLAGALKKAKHTIAGKPEFEWLNYEKIAAPNLGDAGAGGIRQVGRYMMMAKSNEFMDRIENEIKDAKTDLSDPRVCIHIFSGLSGGTGSGCFLDVCYMVRKMAPDANVFGYFFLPDVNLSVVSDNKVKKFISRNGYAAMQELDYCMQIEENGGSFKQMYGGHKPIEWNQPPVDMCHLISATDQNNNVKSNAYNYTMNAVAEYVMDFLTKSENKHDIFSEMANFTAKVLAANGEKEMGSHMRYLSIGASCAVLPLREINTYLASELFSKFSGIGQNKPTKTEVEKLAISAFAQGARNAKEIYEHLLREIRQGAEPNYQPYVQDWRTVRDYGNETMVLHYTNQTAEKTGKLETNAKSMMTESNEKSLLSRVRKELLPILKDVDRGPIYAYGMLEAAVSHNLQNIIDGLLEENKARYKEESIQKRYEEYEEARQNFENRRKRKGVTFDSDEKRFEEYKFRLEKLEKHNLILDMYKQLETVLNTVKKQITNVADMYYQRLSRIMMNLIETFQDNCKALESESALKYIPDFCMPMMTIKELKPSLDEEIQKMDVPNMMTAFMELFVTHEEEWITEEEAKISKLVTKFFVENAFSNFANKTITSFLRDKYQKDGLITDAQLSERIYEDWMKPLTNKANPLFYFNSSVWKQDQTGEIAYLSFPTVSKPIQSAAEKMYSVNNIWALKPSELTDRIYVMRCACGFPLSAYHPCSEYEQIFFSALEAGTHYYEGKANAGVEFTDWNRLPSVTPQSLIQSDEIPEDLKNQVVKAQNLYEKAKNVELFNEESRICAPKEEDIQNILSLLDVGMNLVNSVTEGELDKAEQVLKEIENISWSLYPTEMSMPQDGFRDTGKRAEVIQKDHFLYSPVYQIRVEKTLSQIDEIEQKKQDVLENLTARLEKIKEEKESREAGIRAAEEERRSLARNTSEFCKVLFSGVIMIQGRRYVYLEDEDDSLEDGKILSQPDYPFASIPVYQAFVNYCELDNETKQQMQKEANERYADEAKELIDAGQKLLTVLKKKNIKNWIIAAEDEDGVFAQEENVVPFLKRVNTEFKTFCDEYEIKEE